jgi:hypothetical protein
VTPVLTAEEAERIARRAVDIGNALGEVRGTGIEVDFDVFDKETRAKVIAGVVCVVAAMPELGFKVARMSDEPVIVDDPKGLVIPRADGAYVFVYLRKNAPACDTLALTPEGAVALANLLYGAAERCATVGA